MQVGLPDEEQLQARWDSLDESWDSPCPVVARSHLVGSVSGPSSNDRSKVPGAVVDGGVNSTMLWVHQLSQKKWGSSMSNSDSETDEKAGSDEHAEVDTDGLEDDSAQHDDTTDHDTDAATEDVGDVWDDWEGDDGADWENGVEETALGWGWGGELLLPRLHGLETVHEGAIVSVGCGGEDDEHQADVKVAHLWVGPPGGMSIDAHNLLVGLLTS